jgi:uncharacterized protein YukE
MSDAMRYDPRMMADHVSSQQGLVRHLDDLRTQAQNAIESIRQEWTGLGFGGCDEAHRQVNLAFDQVFQTIQNHAARIMSASDHAATVDSAVNAGFAGI